MAISSYSTSAGSNTTISGINIGEGCPPSGVNDALRQLMADVASGAYVQQAPTSTGSSNAYSVTLSPAPASYSTGSYVIFVASFANTGASTINVNGLGAKNIYKPSSSGATALVGGEIRTGQVAFLVYDGTQFQLLSQTAAYADYPFVVAGGTANALTATFSPAITTLTDGMVLHIRSTAVNTSTAPTLNVNGLGALPITKLGGTALVAGDIAGNLYECLFAYNLANTRWELLNPAYVQTATPQGRLTLTSGTPVMSADVTAATSIYYTPYVGDTISIYDGTKMVAKTFSQLTLALDSNTGHTNYHQSGKVYDLFVFLNSGVVTLGTGVAWSTTTARGTGAGTTELQQTNGLWTNKNSISLRYDTGTTLAVVAAGQATYVGSFYATANGQTAMQMFNGSAIGGGNPYAVLYNAYNRVNLFSRCSDNTASWTYTTNVVRALNNSASNRVNFLDGLGQSIIKTTITQSALGNNIYLGAAIDNTTTPFLSCYNASTVGVAISGANSLAPYLGLHYIQATESGGGGASGTYYGANTLLVEWEG